MDAEVDTGEADESGEDDPGRDPGVCAWLNPLLARLAVRLDERPGRSPWDLLNVQRVVKAEDIIRPVADGGCPFLDGGKS